MTGFVLAAAAIVAAAVGIAFGFLICSALVVGRCADCRREHDLKRKDD